MTITVAHGKSVRSNFTGWGCCSGIAALLVFFGCEGLQSASADDVPVRLAQAGTVSSSGRTTANDVINDRGFWQGVPIAERVEVQPAPNARVTATPASPPTPAPTNPAARRTVATASTGPRSAPWPLSDRKDPEQFPNALSYAAQPGPMTTRALQGTPTKPHVAGHGDTTVVVKQSNEHAPGAAPRNEAALTAAPPARAVRKPTASLVRVGDRFNDPWMRALIVTPSAQDYMATTLFGVPDFRNLGPYLEKPASAVSVAFADDPHPGMATDRFGGNPVTFVSTVPFGTARTPSR